MGFTALFHFLLEMGASETALPASGALCVCFSIEPSVGVDFSIESAIGVDFATVTCEECQ